ncbi:Conserved_hypothetical protein [Hexamita inflata]|uniref:DUF659 domain-containing protein n=1 Tax=Hexamita inflata TaxID=28002 RepID=A0ABP1KL43_9EUKA
MLDGWQYATVHMYTVMIQIAGEEPRYHSSFTSQEGVKQDALWLAGELKRIIDSMAENHLRVKIITGDSAGVISAAVLVLNGKIKDTVHKSNKLAVSFWTKVNYKLIRIRCLAHQFNLVLKDLVTQFQLTQLLQEAKEITTEKYIYFCETRFFGMITTLRSLSENSLPKRDLYISIFQIICDQIKECEKSSAVASNVVMNVDKICKSLKVYSKREGDEADFAIERINYRLLDPDNTIVNII